MNQFNMYLNQLVNICIWFNKNTKIKATILYEGSSVHIELFVNNTNIADEIVEKIEEKSDERIHHEMKRIIEYFLMLKKEQENGGH